MSVFPWLRMVLPLARPPLAAGSEICILKRLFQSVDDEALGDASMPKPKAYDVDEALAGAMRAFWRKGYCATSVDDLEAAMQIKRSSLYHAFGDKEQLFDEALQRYDREVAADLLGEMEQGGGLAAIRRFFSRLLRYHGSETGCNGCMMTNSATELAPDDPAVRERVHTHLLRVERAFHHALRTAQAEGDVPESAPVRDLARHLTAINHGLQVIARMSPAPRFAKSVVRSALSAIPTTR
ncbi:MAG: TetR/AcrR family transcriptional regulator [Gaiellales bacterium]